MGRGYPTLGPTIEEREQALTEWSTEALESYIERVADLDLPERDCWHGHFGCATSDDGPCENAVYHILVDRDLTT